LTDYQNKRNNNTAAAGKGAATPLARPTVHISDDEEEDAGDDGEQHHALPNIAECAARLALGNRIAACSIRHRAVLAFAATGFRAGADILPFRLPLFDFQKGLALV
jgi:hypothetical protein